MKIAISTLYLGHHLAAPLSFVKLAAQLGFHGIEIAQPLEYVAGKPEELKRVAKDEGIEIVGLNHGDVDERIAFGELCSCRYLVVREWNKSLADRFLNTEIAPALHPGFHRPVRLLRDATRILNGENASRLLVVPDTGHMLAIDEPLDAITEIPLDRIAAIHVKDWTPRFGRTHYEYQNGMTLLGEGDHGEEITRMLEKLRRQEYNGWIVAEHDTLAYGRESDMRRQHQWMAERGFIKRSPSVAVPSPVTNESHVAHIESAALRPRLINRLPLKTPTEYYDSIIAEYRRMFPHYLVNLWSVNFARQTLSLQRTSEELSGTRRAHNVSFDANYDNGPLTLITSRQFVTRPVVETTPLCNTHSRLTHLKAALGCFPTGSPIIIDHIVEIIGEKEQPCPAADSLNSAAAMLNERISDAVVNLRSQANSLACREADRQIDFRSYLDSLVQLVAEKLECHGASLFVVYRPRKIMRMAASTGMFWNAGLDYQYYELGEGDVGETWLSGESRFEDVRHASSMDPPKSEEDSNEPNRVATMCVPLRSPGTGEVIAVIRCRNCTTPSDCPVIPGFSYLHASIVSALEAEVAPNIEIGLAEELEVEQMRYISHELKKTQPLIISCARSIERESKSSEVKAASRKIAAYASQIQYRVRNSDLHRAWPSPPRVRPKTASITRDIINHVVAELSPLLGEGDMQKQWIDRTSLVGKAGLDAYLDIDLARLAFFNVLSNAVNYSTEHVRIEIDSKTDREFIDIIVIDRGIGFNSDDEEASFVAARRGPSAPGEPKKATNGQGLGLWVARAICEAHAGNAWIADVGWPPHRREPRNTIVRLRFRR